MIIGSVHKTAETQGRTILLTTLVLCAVATTG